MTTVELLEPVVNLRVLSCLVRVHEVAVVTVVASVADRTMKICCTARASLPYDLKLASAAGEVLKAVFTASRRISSLTSLSLPDLRSL
ncbi:MAG: hypothetical protein IPO88_27530 [Nannocystis sp.]|uniref:hypothetical protein n=1 Tax=Nannocystis sp. TaxID=1962667 RepID=UPI002423570C|nr:hypothetical protein [Nannocystis sp.]MBK9757181.1 hypothetical protein [Nannocystis sp.]